MVSFNKENKGPSQETIADGYSLNDEREPVGGPHLEFDYEKDDSDDDESVPTGMEHHLANPDKPDLHQSHAGEHRGDFNGATRITGAVYLYTFCAALNSVNLGYDIGVNTNAGPLLQDRFGLSDLRLELFFGSLNLFAMVGALAVHFFSDRYGRRYAFMIAALFVIIGSLCCGLAQNYNGLMFGRTFVGLGVGFGLALDPMYISEISPAAYRGQLVTWAEVALNGGIILGFLSGIVFASIDDSSEWRYMIGLGVVIPAIMIILAAFVMPESPRWLVQKAQHDKAARVLQKIYGDDFDVAPIILDMQEAIQREESISGSVGWDMIFFPTPAFRRMLMVGLGMAIAQQAVGIDAIQYFLVFILEEAGLERGSLQSWVLVILGVVKLVFIILGGAMFDRRGRRPLIFVSLIGMSAALLMLSINFFSGNSSSLFAIFALAVYLAMFSLGMGPGAWLTSSEIFATVIRAKAMSVATFLNRVVSTLMSSTFLSTAHAMSWAAFFLMLAVVCIIILIFMYYFLPETKGRSLEDMSIYFAEITGDRSMLEAEEKIIRDRLAREHVEANAFQFEPPKTREQLREKLPDAKVSGTMA